MHIAALMFDGVEPAASQPGRQLDSGLFETRLSTEPTIQRQCERSDEGVTR